MMVLLITVGLPVLSLMNHPNPLSRIYTYLLGKLRADNTVFLYLYHLYFILFSKSWELYIIE